MNSWTVFLEENSIGDCYSGYILGAKPPKLALLNQVKSWSKPIPKLNQTTKPRQECITIIETFKPQTGIFTLLWPVFPAREHCSPQPCSSYSLHQTIFWKILWCPSVPYMQESFKSGLKRRWKKRKPDLARLWIQLESSPKICFWSSKCRESLTLCKVSQGISNRWRSLLRSQISILSTGIPCL